MKIFVDVIIPVHNAADTIEETVLSCMQQCIPDYLIHHDSGENCCCLASNLEPYIKDSYHRFSLKNVQIDVAVCCQNDGSEDGSLKILHKIQQTPRNRKRKLIGEKSASSLSSQISCELLVSSNTDNIARGAGAARNRAASLRAQQPLRPSENDPTFDSSLYFLCMLDSDDVMHPNRIAHQVSVMLALSNEERNSTLLGCTFDRVPADSTWHYTNWANSLTDERLMLERYREVTILQPTWFMTRARFDLLGGYIEAPRTHDRELALDENKREHIYADNCCAYKLIHPQYDTSQTLRLAEDLRLFHAHLCYPYGNTSPDNAKGKSIITAGSLKLIRTAEPLLSYRHRAGQSQSSSTSRKLLLQLRAMAFTDLVLKKDWIMSSNSRTNEEGDGADSGFIIWGAGRDGKDFFKSLPEEAKGLVKCFVDVDEKKINSGYYAVPKKNHYNGDGEVKQKSKRECFKIPILHFSLIAREEGQRKELMNKWLLNDIDDDDELTGRITKRKHGENEYPQDKGMQKATTRTRRNFHAISKKDKVNLKMIETNAFAKLPVVVCVAMYRTNGVLERNVKNIGRKEGVDLWHFS